MSDQRMEATPEFDLPDRIPTLFPHVPWRSYVAMGDSSTEGIGDPVPGYPTGGWAQMVADALRLVRPELEFHNLGKRDLTTRQIRETQLPRALELEPDLVMVIAGGNDMFAEQFDPSVTEDELDAIITPLLDRGTTVYTCTMFDIFSSGLMTDEVVAFARPRFDGLNQAVRRVAERHAGNDRFVFDDATLNPAGHNPEIYSKDLLHANQRGHALAATVMLECLAEHVAKTHAPR